VELVTSTSQSSQLRRPFWWTRTTNPTQQTGGSRLKGRSITIYNARFTTALEINGVSHPAGFGLIGAVFETPVQLTDSSFAGPVSFSNSQFRDVLDLSGSTFGRLDLSEARIAEAKLGSLEVDSDILVGGSKVAKALNADGARVQGVVDLTDGCFNDVSLISASIGLNVVADGAKFVGYEDFAEYEQCATDDAREDDGALDDESAMGSSDECPPPPSSPNAGDTVRLRINGATVGGSIQFRTSAGGRRGCFGGVEILSSRIGNEVHVAGARFYGAFRLNGSHIGGTVFLWGSAHDSERKVQVDDPASFAGSVDLETATFAANVVLGHAEFFGHVSLLGSEVSGQLILDGNSWWFRPPENDDDAVAGRLTLTGTTTVAVRDLTPSSVTTPDAWPSQLDLEGFEYGGGVAESGFLDRPHDWHKEWLRRDADFPRQPYTQLENALRESGRDGPADKVAILRRDRELSQKSLGEWLPWFLWGQGVGYGYEPARALKWILIFVGLGTVAAWWVRPAAKRNALGIGNPLVFSVARLVPFPRMGAAHQVDLSSSLIPLGVRLYFWVHTIVGYLIPLYLVAVIGSLISS
jgi:hypothetical protein